MQTHRKRYVRHIASAHIDMSGRVDDEEIDHSDYWEGSKLLEYPAPLDCDVLIFFWLLPCRADRK